MTARYLRARAIATLFGVSERTVRRWIAEGIIPSVKVGGTRLIPMVELERHMQVPTASLLPDEEDRESDQ